MPGTAHPTACLPPPFQRPRTTALTAHSTMLYASEANRALWKQYPSGRATSDTVTWGHDSTALNIAAIPSFVSPTAGGDLEKRRLPSGRLTCSRKPRTPGRSLTYPNGALAENMSHLTSPGAPIHHSYFRPPIHPSAPRAPKSARRRTLDWCAAKERRDPQDRDPYTPGDQCKHCGKFFGRDYDRKRHQNIRAAVQCGFCTKTLSRRDCLKRHMKTVHKGLSAGLNV
ncbi:hypothetical protein BV25DRAFT_1030488 [Artomyces pyxidatus]|uniref:Uncharacterized protein n=1 Tax=Artomyces pyxidatus TaxID=48021 RepID=A0ACB8SVM2_9AGAM|nr:hypothetical protein BV25DRAFT_1030488 [Artomyces pyxidatus]